jgi:hypothetical protein
MPASFDAQLLGVPVARLLGPRRRRVQVGHHLGVRHLRDDLDDLVHLQLRHVAVAGVQLGGDREVAELGEPAADVLDVLVDAEDLLHDEHGRERPAFVRGGPVGRDGAVLDGDLHLDGGEALGVGGDRVGCDGLGRNGEARGERRHGELAAADRRHNPTLR